METPNLNEAKKNIGELLVTKFRKAAKDDKFSSTGKLDSSFGYDVVADKIEVFAEQYAGALSDGITKKFNPSGAMVSKIVAWMKSKGMQPLSRDKKGRFKKVTESSYKSVAFVIARSISGNSNARLPKNPNGGISKRFGYNGSGFMERVVIEQKEIVKQTLQDALKKDIEMELNKNK